MKTIKATIHTIRHQGQPTTSTKNFGKKFVVFTFKKDDVDDVEIEMKTSNYVRGMQNKHLISVNGYIEEHIETGTRCELTFDISDLQYEPKYSMYNIKTKSIKKLLEVTPEGFLRYLKLKYKGIGPKLSDKIYNFLKKKYANEDSAKILEHFILELEQENEDFIVTMGKKKFQNTKEQHEELNKANSEQGIGLNEDEIQFSVNHNITPNFILRLKKQIIKAMGRNSEYKEHSVIPYLKKTPYLLALDNNIKSFGFKTIDSKVYQFTDKSFWDSADFKKQRKIGFLKFILGERQGSGHLYMESEEVYAAFVKYNEEDKEGKKFEIEENSEFFFEELQEIISSIDKAINPFIIYDNKLFLKDNFTGELFLAKKLNYINNEKLKEEYELNGLKNDLFHIEKDAGITLSDEQSDAILNSINSKISIITGGPGTGKTTISNVLISLLKKKGKKIKILAPTGTAAKRISQVAGLPATTIHRGLGFKGHFEFNAENPLKEDVVICDESSMIDVFLGIALSNGAQNSQLVFIGDVNQLPSVGAGDFLRDMINSKQFQVSKLTKIFRQAGDNPIVQFAYKVNDGAKIPDFFQWYSKKDSLEPKLMILAKDEFKKDINGVENPDYLTNIIDAGSEYGLKNYLVKGDNFFEVQVLVSNNRSNNIINSNLQDGLNPDGQPIPLTKRGKNQESIFRVGDKIIQSKNNYKLDVFNGSIGVIKGYNKHSDMVNIQYMGDTSLKEIPVDVLNKESKLCYSMTIHKSQGQEFPRVVMLVNDYLLNSRELIYTGATRAKNNLVIITNTLLLSMGINNTTQKEEGVSGKSARNTKLKEFLQMSKNEVLQLEKDILGFVDKSKIEELEKEGNKELIETIVFD